MPTKVEYRCPACGPFESEERLDAIACRCGREARRVWGAVQVKVEGEVGRWDPVVGEYVSNNREFMDAVKRGKEAQENILGMDVQWSACDARDSDGLAELHGYSSEQRAADLEGTHRNEREKQNA